MLYRWSLEYIQRANQVMEREMVVQLVFLQLILLMWPSAVEPYLVKPGCSERCGSVTIPYPFGMGNNCFIDQWFEIECNRSKPFLKKLNLEVLEIVLPKFDYGQLNPGLLGVNSPVFSSNCNRSKVISPGTPVNFKGSPFVFSQTKNNFTAAGCHSRALIANIEPVLSGCTSPCGGGCCNAVIPSNLQVLNVTFEGTPEECKYAFIVDKDWSRFDTLCVATVHGLEYVFALLEWGIFDQSAEALSLTEEMYWEKSNFSCRKGTGLPGTIECYCVSGFNGSGYLLGSCEDINEYVKDPYSYAKFRIKIGAVIGLSCGLGLPILIFVLWWLRKAIKKRNKVKRKKMFFKRNGGLLLGQQVISSQGNVETTKLFTSKELEMLRRQNYSPPKNWK